MKHVEVSAKNGDNVATLFQEISEKLTKIFSKTSDGRNNSNPSADKRRKDLELRGGQNTTK